MVFIDNIYILLPAMLVSAALCCIAYRFRAKTIPTIANLLLQLGVIVFILVKGANTEELFFILLLMGAISVAFEVFSKNKTDRTDRADKTMPVESIADNDMHEAVSNGSKEAKR